MLPRTEIFITSSVFEDKFKKRLMQFFSCLFHVTSVTPILNFPSPFNDVYKYDNNTESPRRLGP